MYGKTYKLHNSPALAPAEALLVSSSAAFDGLHDDINFFILACFYRKLLKKRRPHGEREPTIVLCSQTAILFTVFITCGTSTHAADQVHIGNLFLTQEIVGYQILLCCSTMDFKGFNLRVLHKGHDARDGVP